MDYQPAHPLSGTPNPEASHTDAPPPLPWVHVPPAKVPWTKKNPPKVVRFGECVEHEAWEAPKFLFAKRKLDFDPDMRPAKMHITEERMVAQMKKMHISNTYVSSEGSSDTLEDCMLPTLILSKEVQNLPTFSTGLPETLLPKMEKPTRALVLWKPPTGSLSTQFLSSLYSETKTDSDSDLKHQGKNTNNNLPTPDLNSMTTASSLLASTSTSTEMEM